MKKIADSSYIHKEAKTIPGSKAFKDRVTLLFGGNIAGFKQPLLIYRSENTRALKNVIKYTLPVYYHANTKAWMTQALLEDWFVNCFIVLDNAQGHPQNPDDLHLDVMVVYLPKNMTAILQPMDLGWIWVVRSNRTIYAQHFPKQ